MIILESLKFFVFLFQPGHKQKLQIAKLSVSKPLTSTLILGKLFVFDDLKFYAKIPYCKLVFTVNYAVLPNHISVCVFSIAMHFKDLVLVENNKICVLINNIDYSECSVALFSSRYA